MKSYSYDAIVIGSGPNGLSAAICLAQRGLEVLIVESAETIGGGTRTAELTLPGYKHDVCSSIHPLAMGSPFFASLPLEKYGLNFVHSPASLAHPFDDGTAVTLERSVVETAARLGRDRRNYQDLMQPYVDKWKHLAPEILAPLHIPRHPFLLANFGLKAIRSARSFSDSFFSEEKTRAVFAGIAAHGTVPLENTASAAIGLVLMIAAHTVGWAFPQGGAGKISSALGSYFQSLGGKIETDYTVNDVDELPAARVVVFDTTPKQIIRIAGKRLPESYRKRLENYQYGSGAFKMDFALSDPIPWRAQECERSATVHLGGTANEISLSERAHWKGQISRKPFVLLAQTSLFDSSRAPAGKHTAWAYCHVPNNSPVDVSEVIENQIERFAPGFRDCILSKNSLPPTALEKYNANYVGGDINGGATTLNQLFTRPIAKFDPYSIPVKGFYICSFSTPPGGGVHGMCGFHAAQSILSNEF